MTRTDDGEVAGSRRRRDVEGYWDEAFRSLPEADRCRAAELTERLRLAGARDPRGWALSEVGEDIAQLTRFLFLRGSGAGCTRFCQVERVTEIEPRLGRCRPGLSP